jgi:hypothetical protein
MSFLDDLRGVGKDLGRVANDLYHKAETEVREHGPGVVDATVKYAKQAGKLAKEHAMDPASKAIRDGAGKVKQSYDEIKELGEYIKIELAKIEEMGPEAYIEHIVGNPEEYRAPKEDALAKMTDRYDDIQKLTPRAEEGSFISKKALEGHRNLLAVEGARLRYDALEASLDAGVTRAYLKLRGIDADEVKEGIDKIKAKENSLYKRMGRKLGFKI